VLCPWPLELVGRLARTQAQRTEDQQRLTRQAAPAPVAIAVRQLQQRLRRRLQGGPANATAVATGGSSRAGASFFPPPGSAGAANSSSFASTINGSTATAQSIASGSTGQAQATAQTQFSNSNSFITTATSPVAGTAPANALAQVGGAVSNPINAGQSFSVVNGFSSGPLTVAAGSMGAGYGGSGQSLTYQMSADFIINSIFGGASLVDLLDSHSIGGGFSNAMFQMSLNGAILETQSFPDLASAEAFFSNNIFSITLLSGSNDLQLLFYETMISPGGFSFDYVTAAAAATPLPAAWTMMLAGLGALGLLGWRRKRKVLSRLVSAT
jgi:hypothetical protein